MEYNSYENDIKKSKRRIECLERIIINLEQNELYTQASFMRNDLKEKQNWTSFYHCDNVKT